MSRSPLTRWQQMDRLFAEALELPEEQRRAFLEEACGEDKLLLADMTALLNNAAEAEQVIGESATGFAAELLPSLEASVDAAESVPPGQRIGPYRILEEIGRGGMGTVHRAERADGEFEKKVALKLVKRGMDTDEILARFRHERRILAGLEHPHIARMYDGGATDDGRPYFVMELVEGEPITTYCDRRRLTIRERLQLFRVVCNAVQHAHQKLVVHRDIKPSNILIATDGTPRLLDFGIAKLIDEEGDDSPMTRVGAGLLTPEYAAPEQLEGRAVTTATDVYGLGAVLHELLAGRRPFALRSPGTPRLREVEPAESRRPSATLKQAEDAGAVAAARGTTRDRLGRILRADLDAIVLKALEVEPERRYAAVGHLADDIERHLRGLPIHARLASPWRRAWKFARRHSIPVASAALIALSLLGGSGIAMQQARRAAVERDVAQYEREKAEQVTSFLVELFETADPDAAQGERGDTLRVRSVLDRSSARVREELAGQPELQGELLVTLGRIYINLGAFDPAEALINDALMILEENNPTPVSRAVRRSMLARIALERGEFPRADSLLALSVATLDAEGIPHDSLYIALLTEHGLIRSYLGDYDEALALNERALETADRTHLAAGPLRSRILKNLATVRYDLGDYARAEVLFREASEAERVYRRANHPEHASTLNNLAASVHYQGRYDEAEPLYLDAISVATRGLGEAHSAVGDYIQNLATLYADQGRYEEAEPLYRRAVQISEDAFGRKSARTAMLLRNLALNRYGIGDLPEAEALLREIEVSLSEELGPEHLYPALASVALARVLIPLGTMAEALSRLESGMVLLEAQLPPGHFLIETSRRDLGAWHAASGNFALAEPLLLESHAALAAGRGDNHYLTTEARDELRRLYLAWGKPQQAKLFDNTQ
jgi:eukaryotic-like serine/threonine-protein kinase